MVGNYLCLISDDLAPKMMPSILISLDANSCRSWVLVSMSKSSNLSKNDNLGTTMKPKYTSKQIVNRQMITNRILRFWGITTKNHKVKHLYTILQENNLLKDSYFIGDDVCRTSILIKFADDIKVTKEYKEIQKEKSKTKKAYKTRKDFYASWEWKKVRFNTLKKYGAKCMLCGSENRIVVDHIKPRSKFPELELDENNMQVLCNDCNMGKSNDDMTDFRQHI